jgi:hypothetical protein
MFISPGISTLGVTQAPFIRRIAAFQIEDVELTHSNCELVGVLLECCFGCRLEHNFGSEACSGPFGKPVYGVGVFWILVAGMRLMDVHCFCRMGLNRPLIQKDPHFNDLQIRLIAAFQIEDVELWILVAGMRLMDVHCFSTAECSNHPPRPHLDCVLNCKKRKKEKKKFPICAQMLVLGNATNLKGNEAHQQDLWGVG